MSNPSPVCSAESFLRSKRRQLPTLQRVPDGKCGGRGTTDPFLSAALIEVRLLPPLFLPSSPSPFLFAFFHRFGEEGLSFFFFPPQPDAGTPLSLFPRNPIHRRLRPNQKILSSLSSHGYSKQFAALLLFLPLPAQPPQRNRPFTPPPGGRGGRGDTSLFLLLLPGQLCGLQRR